MQSLVTHAFSIVLFCRSAAHTSLNVSDRNQQQLGFKPPAMMKHAGFINVLFLNSVLRLPEAQRLAPFCVILLNACEPPVPMRCATCP